MPLTERDQLLLGALRNHIEHLRARRNLDPGSIEAFGVEDAAVQRWLQLALQCCLDLGDNLLGHLGRPEPPRYRDIFAALEREGILDAPLARTLEQLTGFRNVLVHGYATLTPAETWRQLRRALPALEQFADLIAKR